MDAVWFGIKLAVGLALGFAVIRFLVKAMSGLHELYRSWRFFSAGCTYQSGETPGTPTGWVTRDVRNDDSLLWDVHSNVALRCCDEDPPGAPWRLSNETLGQFLSLAHQYNDFLKKG
jgi:hypothetical protein